MTLKTNANESLHQFVKTLTSSSQMTQSDFINKMFSPRSAFYDFSLSLQQKINYQFKHKNYLVQAFAHSSFFNENKTLFDYSNEKLEFLGDSILNYIVSKYLFHNFSHLKEGDLSKFRAALVNETSLAQLADELELIQGMFFGNSLKADTLISRSQISDVFEALLGAIYLDSNIEQVEKSFNFLIKKLEEKNNKFFMESKINSFDAKTSLQELTMAKFQSLPVYKSKEIDQQLFKVAIYLKDIKLDEITFNSKKKAERKLAENVLNNKLYQKLENQNVNNPSTPS